MTGLRISPSGNYLNRAGDVMSSVVKLCCDSTTSDKIIAFALVGAGRVARGR